jgi:hypothetical protein
MNREAIFENWIPPAGVWSLWARPVLFAQMPEVVSPPAGGEPWRDLDVSWAPDVAEKVVVVVDLPGAESVWMGLALAGRGYRPVPLYNACTGEYEVIDQRPILEALRAGAGYLGGLAPCDAAPAFLLDSRRKGLGRPVQPGVFDNRWQVFPQDFPSATFLLERGFGRAILVGRDWREPAEDLAHVLRRWQDAGMRIEGVDVSKGAEPAPIAVGRPPWYRTAWQRALAILGLRRASGGGFGSVVPRPRQG